jgi:ectoine hydroxylase-related dioxygenase (phytanoyl-CoA dioxygenase family)
MLGKELGRAAQRMQNRKRLTDEEIGVRFCDDLLYCLLPDKESRSHRWHQDLTFGTDRTGGFNVWIAIDEVLPEQGAMRFLTGSHREGPLGEKFGEPGATVLDRYPKLMDIYELSPPFHYLPGDTTIHEGLTIHGTPENWTDKPRWSFIPTYIPADNVEVNHGGLGFPAPHERFPLVYP